MQVGDDLWRNRPWWLPFGTLTRREGGLMIPPQQSACAEHDAPLPARSTGGATNPAAAMASWRSSGGVGPTSGAPMRHRAVFPGASLASAAVGVLVLFTSLGLGPCNAAAHPAGPATWIDRPLDGTVVLSQASLTILAHASSADGLRRFDFFANDSPVGSVAVDADRFAQATAEWAPPGAGDYTLRVHAVDRRDNAGADATAAITVAGGAGTATPSATAPASPSPTPTSSATASATAPAPATATPAAGAVSFQADRARIAAGECATLNWSVSYPAILSVTLNGQPVDPAGQQQVCPAATTRYRLEVLTGAGQEQREITIEVEPAPPAQTPTPALPPPSPTPPATSTATPVPTPTAVIADLALVEFYASPLPEGEVYVIIASNGPGTLTGAQVTLTCSGVITETIDNGTTPVQYGPVVLTVTLAPGESATFDAGFAVDTVAQRYDLTCTIQPVGFVDPVPDNDSYSGTIQ